MPPAYPPPSSPTPPHLQSHSQPPQTKTLPSLPELSHDLKLRQSLSLSSVSVSSDDPASSDRFDLPHKLPSYPPPPSYAQTNDLAAFKFSGPHHNNTKTELELHKPELPPIQSLTTQHDQVKTNTLPSFSALTASAPLYSSPHPQPHLQSHPPPPPPAPAYSPPDPKPVDHWPSLNPLTAYYNPSHAENGEPPMRMDIDTSSNSGASAASPDRFPDGRASSVSLDDPDVRMAAEALGDLRAGQSLVLLIYADALTPILSLLARSLTRLDFVSSPDKSSPFPPSPRSRSNGHRPEPLLSLLTTSHPLVATTIESATSAYNNSKNYSPVFRSGAECVEGYVRPIAGAVGSMSRATGVEGSVRWFLGGGRRHKSQNPDLEAASRTPNKRRKVDNGSNGVGIGDKGFEPGSGVPTPRASLDGTRRSSFASTIDTLPAYDDNRSPPYAESLAPEEHRENPAASRVTMTTSGLGIAMTEESLRSLKYCLGWLRWANDHIGTVVTSLKTTMDKYEKAQSETPVGDDQPMQEASSSSDEATDQKQLAAKITVYKSDVLKTLQDVINTVSRHAGGALPENARDLVRHHLTSLPQRFRVASALGSQQQQQPGTSGDAEQGREKETRESAQRVLVLAREGLDMMTQVSGVLDGTIVSAEEWCERLGQRKRDQRQMLNGGSHQHASPPPPPTSAPAPDVKMG